MTNRLTHKTILANGTGDRMQSAARLMVYPVFPVFGLNRCSASSECRAVTGATDFLDEVRVLFEVQAAPTHDQEH